MPTLAELIQDLFESPLPRDELRDALLRAVQDADQRTADVDERWKALLGASTEGLALSVDGIIVECNERLGVMLGRSAEELIGMNGADLALESERVARNIRERSEVAYQVRGKRADGSTFPAMISGRNVRYRGRDARVSAVRDLTYEIAVLESEERYRELVQLMPVIIGEATMNGTITFLNQLGVRSLGYDSLDQAIGIPIRDHIVPEQHAAMFELMQRRLAGEPATGTEYTLLRRDGSTFPAILHSGVRMVEGQPVGYRVAMLDITVRVQAEDERHALESQVRHVQKLESLGLLAGGIAHDFNNLLAIILGNTEIAAAELPPGHSKRRLEVARKAAIRAAELTEQMLAYTGKATFSTAPLDLNVLITEMAPLLDVSHTKKVRLRLELEEGLPAVQGDAAQLRQVVLNLVTNASEAIGEAGGRVKLSTSYDDGQVVVEVNDDGPGMDEATLARIFDPFFTTKFTGRGLGLAAVQGIVHGHGGEIDVDTAPGAGTSFRICLPVVAAQAVAIADEEPTPIPSATATLLLIDDDDGVREIAAIMLRTAGFAVIEAGDGIHGLELYKQHRADIRLVLLDMTMPGLSGAETYSALVELDAEVSVLACSGFSSGHATTDLRGPQLKGFLQKPYRRAELLMAIGEVLEN